jgi:hypothetical protein
MLSTIILTAAISTYISPTDWNYSQGEDEFTKQKSALAIAQNQQNAFMSIRCDDNQYLSMSVDYPNHNQNLKPKAYAKVDQNEAIELTGKVYPSGLSISEQYKQFKDWGNWPKWLQLIKQMETGKAVKFRLYDLKWQYQEVTFNLTQGKSALADVINQCKR